METSAALRRTTMIIAVLSVAAVGLAGALALRAADPAEVAAGARDLDDAAPLRGGMPSLQALGEAVVAGLAAGDRDALAALLVDERDYKGRLFERLSNHPSAAQMGADLLWDMQRRESLDDMDRAIEAHGGRPLRLLAIEPEGSERRDGIVIHRRPRLRVEGEGGAEQTLQILASVIEHEASGTFVLLGFRYRGASP